MTEQELDLVMETYRRTGVLDGLSDEEIQKLRENIRKRSERIAKKVEELKKHKNKNHQ